MLLITPRDSATRSSLSAMWSIALRPWYPRVEVAMVIPDGTASFRADRMSEGTLLRPTNRWLKSPIKISRSRENFASTFLRPCRYSRWSAHISRFSKDEPLTRDIAHGMQTPTTVTSPNDVCVMPDMNLPGGKDGRPRSSVFRQGSLDHSATFLRPCLIGYP